MKNEIRLSVYRIRDNRYEHLPKESKELVELHNLRKETLHALFNDRATVKVLDWGHTDDRTSHELVSILLTVVGTAVIKPLLIKGIEELGKIMAEKGVEESTSAFIKWLIQKVIKKQKEQKIADCSLDLGDGTIILIDAPQTTSTITMHKNGHTITKIKYHLANHQRNT